MSRIWYIYLVCTFLCIYVSSEDTFCTISGFFRCANKRCITNVFVCDGDNDCGDWSDEKNCSISEFTSDIAPAKCAENEYRCKDNISCISLDKFCDRQTDCPDNSDEYDTCTKEKKCDDFHFRCDDGYCVRKEWVCDSVYDCEDKSDEKSCGNKTMSLDECTERNDRYLCANKRCIPLEMVCNWIDNCGDGSDEDERGCKEADEKCSVGTSHCSHFCRKLPTGSTKCTCRPGFSLVDDHSCEDINECLTYGMCDQRCVNTKGSYRCLCQIGFVLQPDGKRCKANLGQGLLVVSTGEEIRGLYLDSWIYFLLQRKENRGAIAVDSNDVYWTDGKRIIKSWTGTASSKNVVIIDRGIDGIWDIGVDWITGNVYFAEGFSMFIGVCSNKSLCTKLIEKSYGYFALAPLKGIIYWSEESTVGTSSDYGISMSCMDGKPLKRFFIKTNDGPALHLTIDYPSDRLYWTDMSGKIETVLLDGVYLDRKVILEHEISHPWDIRIFEDHLYWIEVGHVYRCDKFTGKNRETILAEKHAVRGMNIYHPSLHPITYNPCYSNPCSEICLLNSAFGYSCACTDGKKLNPDNHTCTQIEENPHLIISFQYKLFDYYHASFGKAEKHEILTARTMQDLVYDSINGDVLGYDRLTKSIIRFNVESREIQTLVSFENGELLDGMDFDYLGNNLYWSDEVNNAVEIFSFHNFAKKRIYFHDKIPSSIALVPEEGLMFVVLRKHIRHEFAIYSMNMTGLGPKTPMENSIEYADIILSYDRKYKRLYFAGLDRRFILQSMNLDGSDYRRDYAGFRQPEQFFITGDYIFFLSIHSTALYWKKINELKLNKDFNTIEFGLTDLTYPKSIAVVRGKNENKEHPCRNNNGNCSHICLVINSRSHICACNSGEILDADNRTCIAQSTTETPELKCDVDEMKCLTKELCVKLNKRCDGANDCPNGEDESNCTSCNDDEYKCENGDCIDAKKRCNSHIDCKDRSDELNCDKTECQNDQFECREGTCIPNDLVCNQEFDCPDLSDELNCTRVTCSADEFMCSNRLCIPSKWKCDGQEDCPDGSDEGKNCTKDFCPPNMFVCKNGDCIDDLLVCNNVNDCRDNSDETDCVKGSHFNITCDKDQYKCYNTDHCIAKEKLCNHVQDCPKNDDEHDCSFCETHEYLCDNKKCIPLSWICNAFDDCGDNSDERYCNSTAYDSSKSRICPEFTCKLHSCVSYDDVCNKVLDCLDGSDEGGKCDTACIEDDPCEYKCIRTPQGPICTCPDGYRMDSNNSCIDIDECRSSPCSQICHNTNGSFSCDCYDGFLLHSDKVTCKSDGWWQEIIAAKSDSMVKIGNSVQHIYSAPNLSIAGFDVNVESNTIYWSNNKLGEIGRININGERHKVISEVGKPGPLSVDWITDNIYFYNDQNPFAIQVCDLEEEKCAEIIPIESSKKVVSILADSINGWIFWSQVDQDISTKTTTGIHGKIYRSTMAGSDIITIAEENVGTVSGITIDYIRSRLYWIDLEQRIIESSNFDGKGREIFKHTWLKPIGLDIAGNFIFWAVLPNYNTDIKNILRKCSLIDTAVCGMNYVSPITHFSVLHQPNHTLGYNHCQNRTCDHMCVLNGKNYSCVCQDGLLINENSICLEPMKSADRLDNEEGSPVMIIVIAIAACVIVIAFYCYYHHTKDGTSKKNGVSVHFQNPSYNQRNEIFSSQCFGLGIPPLMCGENEYTNPTIDITAKIQEDEKVMYRIMNTTHSDQSENETEENSQNSHLIN